MMKQIIIQRVVTLITIRISYRFHSLIFCSRLTAGFTSSSSEIIKSIHVKTTMHQQKRDDQSCFC